MLSELCALCGSTQGTLPREVQRIGAWRTKWSSHSAGGWIYTWRDERVVKQKGRTRGPIRDGSKSASSVPGQGSREQVGGVPSLYPLFLLVSSRVFASFPGPGAFCFVLRIPLSNPQMSLVHLVSVALCSEMLHGSIFLSSQQLASPSAS